MTIIDKTSRKIMLIRVDEKKFTIDFAIDSMKEVNEVIFVDFLT